MTKEEFQVNGWPPLLDPGLPDPRALGEVLRLRKWRLLIRQLPMLKPGSLPGGESGAPLCYAPVSGSQQHPWVQNSVHGSFGLTRSSFSLPQDVHRPPGVWDRNGPIPAQALSSNLYPFLSLASCRSATFFFVMSPLPGIHFPSVPFGFCLASQISSCASPQSGMTGSKEDPHSFLSKVFV